MDHLGYEITRAELKLMPTIMSCVIDNWSLDVDRLTDDDKTALYDWESRGLGRIGGHNAFHVTEKFYRAMSEILLVAYCTAYIYKDKKRKPLVEPLVLFDDDDDPIQGNLFGEIRES